MPTVATMTRHLDIVPLQGCALAVQLIVHRSNCALTVRLIVRLIGKAATLHAWLGL